MNQLGAVYPNVYQEWPDKHSDDAHVRMALCGLGAKRIDLAAWNASALTRATAKVTMKDKKFYVVKTNMLATLPVREGFERASAMNQKHFGGALSNVLTSFCRCGWLLTWKLMTFQNCNRDTCFIVLPSHCNMSTVC